MSLTFNLQHTDGNARAGVIKTARSTIQTPIFMPVGTLASVKSLDSFDLQEHLQAQIILANTYHLYLRPSSQIIKEMGGIHKFSNFPKTLLTDSVNTFSIEHLLNIVKVNQNYCTVVFHFHKNIFPFQQYKLQSWQDHNPKYLPTFHKLHFSKNMQCSARISI